MSRTGSLDSLGGTLLSSASSPAASEDGDDGTEDFSRLIAHIDAQVASASSGGGGGGDDAYESALLDLERMAPFDQVLSLDLSVSLRLSLSCRPPTTLAALERAPVARRHSPSTLSHPPPTRPPPPARPFLRPFLEVELRGVRARLLRRLKYTQATLTVAALNAFDTSRSSGVPRSGEAAFDRANHFLTTHTQLQHYHRSGNDGRGNDDDDDQEVAAAKPGAPWLDLSFESPLLSDDLRARLRVRTRTGARLCGGCLRLGVAFSYHWCCRCGCCGVCGVAFFLFLWLSLFFFT